MLFIKPYALSTRTITASADIHLLRGADLMVEGLLKLVEGMVGRL